MAKAKSVFFCTECGNETPKWAGRCAVWQGSVEQIIFASGWFDAVTAFETVYFWPDLPKSFREIRRVLRPGGTLLICNECSGDAPGDEAWTKKIAGMRIYPAAELQRLLEFMEKYCKTGSVLRTS